MSRAFSSIGYRKDSSAAVPIDSARPSITKDASGTFGAKTIPDLIGADGLFVDGDWVETKDQDPNGDVRLIQLADVGDGVYRNKSARFLTNSKAMELGCTFLKEGDLLVARMPDPLGRACIFPGDEKPSITVVDVCIVRTGTGGTNHRWLMHRINSAEIRSVIAGLQSGSTRKRISRSNLARIRFSVPSPNEQQRIVAEVEKQFTRLDAGVASLKSVQTALKRYRTSVLKAACEGRLVPTEAELARKENRSFETGEQLLQRILNERRVNWNGKGKYKDPVRPTQPSEVDLPEGWAATLIEPLLSTDRVGIKTGPFGSLLKKHEHRANGVPVLGIENISNMRFVPGNKIFIEKTKADQLAGYDAREGDALVSRSGTVGEVCVVPKGVGAARISSNVMRVSLLPTGLLPEFFSILFNGSPAVLRQISQLCSGSTRDFLNQEILRSIVFPLPPSAEQRRIVAEVERRISVIEELEAATSKEVQRAIRLRQAMLRSAFSETLA